MVLVKVWSHPLLVHHCLSSGFSCKLTSCQNCVRSPPPLHSFSPHPTPRQALGLLPFFLPQHEILGKFQILGVIVSIISEPKGGAHNPLWIPVLHICSLLWLREPTLRAALLPLEVQTTPSISSLSMGIRILSSAPPS